MMRLDYNKLSVWKDVSLSEWNDWHWQLRNSIKSVNDLYKVIELPEELRKQVEKISEVFPLSLTPYFSLVLRRTIERKGIEGAMPLLKTVIPTIEEVSKISSEDIYDAVGEEKTTRSKCLFRFYPDRVLLFVTNFCAVYCRYCFRRKKVSDLGQITINRQALKEAFEYIKKSPSRNNIPGIDPMIQEVIISGGDPLVISNEMLEWIFGNLRQIPNIKLIRIDTKVPVVLPQRINDELISLFKKYNIFYIIIHFTHPDEITDEVKEACIKLANSGIVLGSHTPLLKGVNDSAPVLKELFLKLIEIKVRPYYLIHFIPTKWTEHFRTSISKGIKMIEELWGHISGLANPIYIVYLPKGKGKVPVYPNYIIGRTREGYIFRNFENEEVLFWDPL